jgi:hypothetical protein
LEPEKTASEFEEGATALGFLGVKGFDLALLAANLAAWEREVHAVARVGDHVVFKTALRTMTKRLEATLLIRRRTDKA